MSTVRYSMAMCSLAKQSTMLMLCIDWGSPKALIPLFNPPGTVLSVHGIGHSKSTNTFFVQPSYSFPSMLASQAAVRSGCILVSFDLIQPCTAESKELDTTELSKDVASVVQGWLGQQGLLGDQQQGGEETCLRFTVQASVFITGHMRVLCVLAVLFVGTRNSRQVGLTKTIHRLIYDVYILYIYTE